MLGTGPAYAMLSHKARNGAPDSYERFVRSRLIASCYCTEEIAMNEHNDTTATATGNATDEQVREREAKERQAREREARIANAEAEQRGWKAFEELRSIGEIRLEMDCSRGGKRTRNIKIGRKQTVTFDFGNCSGKELWTRFVSGTLAVQFRQRFWGQAADAILKDALDKGWTQGQAQELAQDIELPARVSILELFGKTSEGERQARAKEREAKIANNAQISAASSALATMEAQKLPEETINSVLEGMGVSRSMIATMRREDAYRAAKPTG